MWRVHEQQQALFADQPEIAMDTQIGRMRGREVAVIGCRLVIAFDGELPNELRRRREIIGTDLHRSRSGNAVDAYDARFTAWLRSLDPADGLSLVTDPEEGRLIMGLIHHGLRPGTSPAAPARPRHIYGHLPHHGQCDGSDIFDRYEAFSTSLRIDKARGEIKPDTYAAPFSERDLTPTGLSAVGRFALPSLDPHRWRWELQPVKDTVIHYGASVPLYGQAGGAVEVMFPAQTQTTVAQNAVVPVPAPHVLDVL